MVYFFFLYEQNVLMARIKKISSLTETIQIMDLISIPEENSVYQCEMTAMAYIHQRFEVN